MTDTAEYTGNLVKLLTDVCMDEFKYQVWHITVNKAYPGGHQKYSTHVRVTIEIKDLLRTHKMSWEVGPTGTNKQVTKHEVISGFMEAFKR